MLYLVLFGNSFQLNFEGLIVGTTIGGSIGTLDLSLSNLENLISTRKI